MSQRTSDTEWNQLWRNAHADYTRRYRSASAEVLEQTRQRLARTITSDSRNPVASGAISAIADIQSRRQS